MAHGFLTFVETSEHNENATVRELLSNIVLHINTVRSYKDFFYSFMSFLSHNDNSDAIQQTFLYPNRLAILYVIPRLDKQLLCYHLIILWILCRISLALIYVRLTQWTAVVVWCDKTLDPLLYFTYIEIFNTKLKPKNILKSTAVLPEQRSYL